jgi:hypothetical protein
VPFCVVFKDTRDCLHLASVATRHGGPMKEQEWTFSRKPNIRRPLQIACNDRTSRANKSSAVLNPGPPKTLVGYDPEEMTYVIIGVLPTDKCV